MSKLLVTTIITLLSYNTLSWDICKNSNRACKVEELGECCSKFGYCGTDTAWCNPDSIYGYYEKFPTSSPVSGPSPPTSNRPVCPSHEEPCPNDECCSASGYCGKGYDFCNEDSIYLTAENMTYPTPAPTRRKPKPVFTGCPCIIEGDPHVHQFNCFRINYQGPHKMDPPGSFKYVTTCNGYNLASMPFEIIGVHTRWGDYFTALDYTIVQLHDISSEGYCELRVSGEHGVSLAGDGWELLAQNTPIKVCNDFTVKWYRESHTGIVKFTVDLSFDEECVNDIEIDTQRLFNTVWQDAATIRLSECYRKYTCGLCGSYERRFPLFETSIGEIVTLDQQYFGPTAENFDAWGYLVAGSRPTIEKDIRRRMIIDNYTYSDLTTACFNKENELTIKCTNGLSKYKECCNLRNGYCERNTIPECAIDACACISYKMGKNGINTVQGLENTNYIDECVRSTLDALTNFTCNIDNTQFTVPGDVLPINMTNVFCTDLVNQATISAKNQCTLQEKGLSTGASIVIGIVIGVLVTIIVSAGIYGCIIKTKAKQGTYGFNKT